LVVSRLGFSWLGFSIRLFLVTVVVWEGLLVGAESQFEEADRSGVCSISAT
jgi:hypothetical protein